jgi:uncharacterized protein HemX
MAIEIRKWLFTATLAVALVVGAGVSGAKGQNPNEPHPGSQADQREDNRERRQLKLQVEEDNRRLQADINQFGRRSPQARDDRHRLREDRRRLRALRRDGRRDKRVRERGEN